MNHSPQPLFTPVRATVGHVTCLDQGATPRHEHGPAFSQVLEVNGCWWRLQLPTISCLNNELNTAPLVDPYHRRREHLINHLHLTCNVNPVHAESVS